MPVYKKNNKWYAVVNYVGLDGKYKKAQSKYYKTKREALDSEFVLRQKYKNEDRHSITFYDAYQEYREKKKSEIKPQSVIRMDNLFECAEALNNIKVDKLTMQQFKAFKNELSQKDCTTKYKNRVLSLICSVVDYCNQTYGIYNDVPRRCGNFREDSISQEMQYFTIEEFERFIVQEDDIVFKTLFTLLFFNGLRIGEALALTWKDYDGKEISITKTLVTKIKGVKDYPASPKTKASIRRLPVNARVKSLLDALSVHYKAFPYFDDQWFIFGGIKSLPMSTVALHKNEACKKAEVKQIRIHDFRHSCASYYIVEKKAPIILVSKLLGHARISMTLDTYSHLYPNELSKLMEM